MKTKKQLKLPGALIWKKGLSLSDKRIFLLLLCRYISILTDCSVGLLDSCGKAKRQRQSE